MELGFLVEAPQFGDTQNVGTHVIKSATLFWNSCSMMA